MTIDRATFLSVVGCAVRAPSMHNAQPWRFRLTPDGIEVTAAGPAGWATRIACGAAVFNLRLALAVRGIATTLDRDPTLVRPCGACVPTPAQVRLARAVVHRHSNRYPFSDRPVPPDARHALIAAAAAEGARLDFAGGPAAVDAVADLARRAARRLGGSDAEALTWSRDGHEPFDGVPAAAGGPAGDGGELLPRRAYRTAATAGTWTYEREPLLAVLSVGADGPADQLRAGEALQRVLLTATDLGLAVSMYSQPIEVPDLRVELRDTVHTGRYPQMLLRLGHAPAAPASGRRPVEDVVLD